MDARALVREFEHECSLAGGVSRTRAAGRFIVSRCDLGSVEVELEVPRGGGEYTLSAVWVSDEKGLVSRVFGAVQELTGE